MCPELPSLWDKGLNSKETVNKQEQTIFLEIEATVGGEEGEEHDTEERTDHFAMTIGTSPQT
jgi:hypothetical protein